MSSLLHVAPRRRSTVDIPPNRDAYSALLLKHKQPMSCGYPTMLSRGETSKIYARQHQKNLFNVDINNVVLKSWIMNEDKMSPATKPTIAVVPRAIQLHAAEVFNKKGELGFRDALKNFKELVDGFVIVIPVFDKINPTPWLATGFLLSTESTYFAVQATDEQTMKIFREDIMEEESIYKIMINAQRELQVFWTQAFCSPTSVLCLTTAAIHILQEFGIEHHRDATDITAGTSKVFPFWKYFDICPLPTATDYMGGLNDNSLQSTVKSVVSLTSIIQSGALYVPVGPGSTWRACWKFNRLRSIQNLRNNYLTSQLGINFWPAISQATTEGLDIPVFTLCFLRANFGAILERGDAGFLAALDIYNDVKEVVMHPEAYQAELETNDHRADAPYASNRVFKYLAANIILSNVQIHHGTEMGSVGELLRRIAHYIPCCAV